jgi:hypothetical protein
MLAVSQARDDNFSMPLFSRALREWQNEYNSIDFSKIFNDPDQKTAPFTAKLFKKAYENKRTNRPHFKQWSGTSTVLLKSDSFPEWFIPDKKPIVADASVKETTSVLKKVIDNETQIIRSGLEIQFLDANHYSNSPAKTIPGKGTVICAETKDRFGIVADYGCLTVGDLLAVEKAFPGGKWINNQLYDSQFILYVVDQEIKAIQLTYESEDDVR